MKSTSLVSLLLAVAGPFSVAHALPPSVLTLEVVRPTFETWISNRTATAISSDAYQITSDSGDLSPTTWQSIADSAAANPAAVAAALGPAALDFIEPPNQTITSMSELNPFGVATWQPGTRWSIGFPFGHALQASTSLPLDAVFEYLSPGVPGVTVGLVEVVPEPTAFALLAGLSLCLLQVRRRS